MKYAQGIVTVLLCQFALVGCAAGPEPELHQAVAAGDIAKVRALLNRGVDANLTDGSEQTPLYHAILNDRFDIAQVLIDHGANVNWSTAPRPFTPLAFAVNRNDVKAATWLLEHGAVTSKEPATTHEKIAPMHLAANHGDANMIETLVKYGCSADAKDFWNRRPIEMAKGPAVDTLKKMLSRPAKVS